MRNQRRAPAFRPCTCLWPPGPLFLPLPLTDVLTARQTTQGITSLVSPIAREGFVSLAGKVLLFLSALCCTVTRGSAHLRQCVSGNLTLEHHPCGGRDNSSVFTTVMPTCRGSRTLGGQRLSLTVSKIQQAFSSHQVLVSSGLAELGPPGPGQSLPCTPNPPPRHSGRGRGRDRSYTKGHGGAPDGSTRWSLV